MLPLANTRSVGIRLFSWNGKASQGSHKCLERIAYHCWSEKARPALRYLACNHKHCFLRPKIFSRGNRCYPSGRQTWKTQRPIPKLLRTHSSLGCNNFWMPSFRYPGPGFLKETHHPLEFEKQSENRAPWFSVVEHVGHWSVLPALGSRCSCRHTKMGDWVQTCHRVVLTKLKPSLTWNMCWCQNLAAFNRTHQVTD